uniref:hypothetical protein n=1 Tax=uncultured Draconibacterium sp. TaxID=1573823 RepID=UPI003216D130
MKTQILKLSLFALLLLYFGAGCKDDNTPLDETIKAENYFGVYSGDFNLLRMAPNGYLVYENPVVEEISTTIEITPSNLGDDFLMVYVSAYNDSILCQFDESTGYIWIRDTAYSFYLRTRDFAEFDGNYDHAVSTYGNLGTWSNTDTVVFSIDFLKDFNDSIYYCDTKTKKIN